MRGNMSGIKKERTWVEIELERLKKEQALEADKSRLEKKDKKER